MLGSNTTVGQLIKMLQALDPKLPVALRGPDEDAGPSLGEVSGVEVTEGKPTFNGYETKMGAWADRDRFVTIVVIS